MENLLPYEQLFNILESVPDGIVVADKAGNYLYINKAYETITGLNQKYLQGKNVRDLLDAGEISDCVTFSIVDSKKKITIVQSFHRTGRKVLITGNPIFDKDGEVEKVVSTLRDITEMYEIQKKLDETIKESKLYQDELTRLYKSKNNEEIISISKEMENVLLLAQKVADFESSVLIYGESGVGKEKVARYIYSQSARAEGPFVAINCGAIPENLIESELFGYEEGAFTGAKKTGKLGLFEIANGGVVFLDEVGELPLNVQVKLLRVLQERKIFRVGSIESKPVDFRLVAATNKNLHEMVTEGKFREDLFYRLNVVPIKIPPLRERKQDVPQLAFYFLKKYNEKYGLNKIITPDVMEILLSYEWPGNVRELENMIERLAVTSAGDTLFLEGAFNEMREIKYDDGAAKLLSLKSRKEMAEKGALQELYKQVKSTRKIASLLGVNQSTIVRKLNKYGIRADE